ncbi:glycosyltransferase family 9 protein [Candidatus Avelusimicrobium gallicola]|nr:glycosyltransferase family 9 protein [Elusimicrobium sp. An273]
MSLKHWIYSFRPLCVAYETLRWLWHKIFFFIHTPTPVWYQFDRKHQPVASVKETLPMDKNWYRICRPLYRHEHVYYDLQKALAANPNVKGVALIFFMGIGDYLYTTPMLAALKQKFPRLPFYAYVGAQFDRNNSPLVGKLLAENPNFEKVFYFNGTRHPLIWKNYDYSDAFKDIPEGFLAVPVYYDYGVHVGHRVTNLFETFSLPVPERVPAPVMYFAKDIAPAVADYLARARRGAQGKKGIVFLQLDSRGSNYAYPHMKALAQGLIQEGYFVMSVTKGGPTDNPDYLEIDIKKLAINQTWQFLSILKGEFPLYVIAVNSVFWAASAGMQLPNLGLQHWIDKKVHNLWYPNIEVVTNYIYPHLPREKQLFAPPESYTRHNKKIIDYKPDWVIKWFKEKFEK